MDVDPAQLRIVRYPAPVLRQRAEAVDPADEQVRAVARRMLELMHEAEGLGLAAPQVGLPWRMFVTGAADESDVDRVFMNPVLEPAGPPVVHEEGCLSLPGIHVDVRRPEGASITATGLDGASFTLSSEAFIARVWQHEFDHLEGVLIIDKMSPIERLATRKALKTLEAEHAGT